MTIAVSSPRTARRSSDLGLRPTRSGGGRPTRPALRGGARVGEQLPGLVAPALFVRDLGEREQARGNAGMKPSARRSSTDSSKPRHASSCRPCLVPGEREVADGVRRENTSPAFAADGVRGLEVRQRGRAVAAHDLVRQFRSRSGPTPRAARRRRGAARSSDASKCSSSRGSSSPRSARKRACRTRPRSASSRASARSSSRAASARASAEPAKSARSLMQVRAQQRIVACELERFVPAALPAQPHERGAVIPAAARSPPTGACSGSAPASATRAAPGRCRSRPSRARRISCASVFTRPAAPPRRRAARARRAGRAGPAGS